MRELRRSKLILGILVLFLSLSSSRCTSKRPDVDHPKKLVVLFLLDVTNSLVREENDRVVDLAAGILDSLPPDTKFAMYPIQIEPSRLPAIIPDGVVPPQKTNIEKSDYEKTKPARKNEIKTRVQKLYSDLGSLPEDRRTCILNLLWFAQDYLNVMSATSNLDPVNYQYRLVIISDMIEECANTKIGEVTLNKQDISAEIVKADDFSHIASPPDFSHVRITVIFPLSEKSPVDSSRRPSDQDLRTFWQKIFRHCNIQDNWFWSPDHIEWIPTGQLPNWTKPTQNTHGQ